MKKILIIRFSSLGDVILTTPLLPNLKARWPDCHITFLTKVQFASVFDNNPHVDSVLVMDSSRQPFFQLAKEIKEHGYDIIVDLQGNWKSWYLRLVAGPPVAIAVDKCTLARRLLVTTKWNSKKLSTSVRERALNCLIPLDVPIIHQETQLFPSQVAKTLNTFSVDSSKTLIGIAPGAKHNTKRWSPEQFGEAANRLGAIPNSLVVILGDKSDQETANQVLPFLHVPYKNLTGWTNLPELTAVMSKLSFLLTNDSGLMHMGEALNIPLVALFGPTVRAFGFAPYRKTSRVVEVVNLSCRPCSLHGDEQCPLKHHKCMVDIDLNAVLYAVSSVFDPTGTAVL
jgi:heptosyltransferase II